MLFEILIEIKIKIESCLRYIGVCRIDCRKLQAKLGSQVVNLSVPLFPRQKFVYTPPPPPRQLRQLDLKVCVTNGVLLGMRTGRLIK